MTFTLIIHRRLLIVCLILLCCSLGVARAQQNPARVTQHASPSGPRRELFEEFSFYIKDFKMDHQGEVQTLNIKISALYVSGIRTTAYPDFRLIARDVETYLSKYPNKTDYWEIVNKKLTQLILDKYP